MNRIPTGNNAGLTYPEVFLRQVDRRGEGCWEWTGSLYRNGYGRFSVKDKGVLAHRYAFEVLGGGLLQPGKVVCHTCDNRKCVNPAHLRQETQKWNMEDAKGKGQLRAVRGEASPRAKLAQRDVDAMRAAYWSGATQRALAAQYGVSAKQVSLIVRGKQWSASA